MICCKQTEKPANPQQLREGFVTVKEYDPQPKNRDGSIQHFLYRWDDGKSGVRRLVRCRHCGRFFLIQAYHLNKFSVYADTLFEDWYPVESERQADQINSTYTGPQWERLRKPVLRCVGDKVEICTPE